MAVLPAVAPGTAGIGCRIARPVVLTIGVRVVLRAIAGFFDDGLRQCGSRESSRGDGGGADPCEFHLGLLDGVRGRWQRAVSRANQLLASSCKRDNPAAVVTMASWRTMLS